MATVQEGLAERMRAGSQRSAASQGTGGRRQANTSSRRRGAQAPRRQQAVPTGGRRPVPQQYATPGRPQVRQGPQTGQPTAQSGYTGAVRPGQQPQPARPVGTLANQTYMGGSQQAGYRGYSPEYYQQMRAERAAQAQPPQGYSGGQGGYTGAAPPPPVNTYAQPTAQPQPVNTYPNQPPPQPTQMDPRMLAQYAQQVGQGGMDPRQFSQFAQGQYQPPQRPQLNTMQQWNPNQRWR